MRLDNACSLVTACIGLLSAGHALMNKRDSRAALGWLIIIAALPLLGPCIYFIFGINRVYRRTSFAGTACGFSSATEPHKFFGPGSAFFNGICQIGSGLSPYPVSHASELDLLRNGEQAYPAMLNAIANARDFVILSSYIFETDEIGTQIINALVKARDRGVEVYVLLDGLGEYYSWPLPSRKLQSKKLNTSRFLPPSLWPPRLSWNLRNHRKILVVDNKIGFVGGMNIRDRHIVNGRQQESRIVDLHFRFRGPIVEQFSAIFADDWQFATGSELPLRARGESSIVEQAVRCRCLTDGPDNNLDKLTTILLGAISLAKTRVCIITPYFLPPRELVAALQAAALRGVSVEVVLPSKNNIPLAHWASRKGLWELLQYGIDISYAPPPFMHTKLVVIDSVYSIIGSANIDPRSLRLNFELSVEIYDTKSSRELEQYFDDAKNRGQTISYEDMEGRPTAVKLRDAAAWLWSPYL